jgi:hypothetical protein
MRPVLSRMRQNTNGILYEYPALVDDYLGLLFVSPGGLLDDFHGFLDTMVRVKSGAMG